MTETYVAGHGRFWPLDLAEPLPPPGPLILAARNSVIETSYRDGRTQMVSTGGLIAGTRWRWTASNPFHSANAITTPWTPGVDPINALFTWRLIAGPHGIGDAGEGPGARVLVNLSPLPLSQGTALPLSAVPTRSGYVIVPDDLVIADAWGFLVAADYAPGPVSVDEGWQVELECLDCEEQQASAAGGLLRGHGALASDL